MHRSVDGGPRERLFRFGSEHLSDAELLAIVLGTGSAQQSVEQLATAVLGEVGGLRGLATVGPVRLTALHGLGRAKAARIEAALDLGRRTAALPAASNAPLSTSAEVFALLAPRFRHAQRESFVAVVVDAKHRPLAERRIGTGGSSHCPVDIAQVFSAVLVQGGTGVVLAHNHPSGDPTPSDDDIAITHRLQAASQLLGIHLLDHVIVGHGAHFSFCDAGWLDPR